MAIRDHAVLARRSSVHLDLIRGVAALTVLVGHVRGLFFVDFPTLSHPSPTTRLLYAVTGLGHQAVIVFFVLSGYFIGSSIFRSLEEQQWSWRVYLTNRVTRLQLVLLPALILGAMWDQMGMRIPDAVPLYYGGLYKFFGPSVYLRSGFLVYLGNFFFLQPFLSPVAGSNGPLWSLSYEFWYYMLFPALMLAAASWAGRRNRLLYLGLAMLLFWFVGPTISLYFLIWLAGALVARLPQMDWLKSSHALPPVAAGTGLLFALSLAWNRFRPLLPEEKGDFLIGVCFALWLYVLIHGRRQDAAPAYAKTAKTLAGFSYTLYLTHFPVLLFIRALFNPQGNWQPGPTYLLYAAGIGVAMMAYAFVVAQFTEMRTAVVRKRLLQPWTIEAKEVAR